MASSNVFVLFSRTVDDLNLDENRLLAKARSNASIFNLAGCDFCSDEAEIDLRESNDSRNFTSAFNRLQLENSHVTKEAMIPPFGDRGTQTCACENCLESEEPTKGIMSREISTMRIVVQGPEILNYQGTQYTAEDIARYWKKDSRMWLWKSVRLARRQSSEHAKSPPIDCDANSERKDVP